MEKKKKKEMRIKVENFPGLERGEIAATDSVSCDRSAEIRYRQ